MMIQKFLKTNIKPPIRRVAFTFLDFFMFVYHRGNSPRDSEKNKDSSNRYDTENSEMTYKLREFYSEVFVIREKHRR